MDLELSLLGFDPWLGSQDPTGPWCSQTKKKFLIKYNSALAKIRNPRNEERGTLRKLVEPWFQM